MMLYDLCLRHVQAELVQRLSAISDAVAEPARSRHGETILTSFEDEVIEFEGLEDEDAERLSDLVDDKLQQGLMSRTVAACRKPPVNENWRRIYFGEEAATA